MYKYFCRQNRTLWFHVHYVQAVIICIIMMTSRLLQLKVKETMKSLLHTFFSIEKNIF